MVVPVTVSFRLVTTPGTSDDHGVVVADGRDGPGGRRCSASVSRFALCTSTIGVSPVTVIVSASVPTLSSALMVAVNDPVSSMPSRLNVLNPCSVNVTV